MKKILLTRLAIILEGIGLKLTNWAYALDDKHGLDAFENPESSESIPDVFASMEKASRAFLDELKTSGPTTLTGRSEMQTTFRISRDMPPSDL